MKYKVFFLTFLLLTIISCSNKYHLNEKELKMLNSEIDMMYVNDQSARLYFDKIDSIFGIDKRNNLEMYKSNNQRSFLGEEKYQVYKFKNDSLWKVINRIDEYNTNKLIEITEKYGFPSNQRLKVNMSKAYFLFVYSSSKYFDKINVLIENEFKEGRISEYCKEYIFWHTKKGRKGMPPMSGKNGEAIYNNF